MSRPVRKPFRLFAIASAASAGIVAMFAACSDYAAAPAEDGGASSSGTTSSGGSSGTTSSSGASSSGASSSGSIDAGDGGGDGSTAFDVRSLTGVKLWLESTKELTAAGGSFAKWADQSGAWDGGAGAPDGGRHVAEPLLPNPPTIATNGINGRPTVLLTAGNGNIHIANHPDWQFGPGDFVIVSVAKVSSGIGPLWHLRPQSTAGSEQLLATSQLCVQFGAGVVNGCTTPAYVASFDPHVFVARRKGDLFTLRVDGIQRSSLDRAGDPPSISINEFAQPYVFIGKDSSMQVSEVIVQVGPISEANLTTLEAHLKSKYAIP